MAFLNMRQMRNNMMAGPRAPKLPTKNECSAKPQSSQQKSSKPNMKKALSSSASSYHSTGLNHLENSVSGLGTLSFTE